MEEERITKEVMQISKLEEAKRVGALDLSHLKRKPQAKAQNYKPDSLEQELDSVKRELDLISNPKEKWEKKPKHSDPLEELDSNPQRILV